MAKITLKDIINGQAKAKDKSYNRDLFKSDSENITESFNKSDYDFICLIGSDTDEKSGLLKETIIAYKGADSYLINTIPHEYNGEVSINIYQKWLTLQGFNFFIKESLEVSQPEFIDDEGKLTFDIIEYYNNVLNDEGYEIQYHDILDLGEFNSEYNCLTLQWTQEETQEKHFITINEKQQLSKITKKKLATNLIKKEEKAKPVIKSILG